MKEVLDKHIGKTIGVNIERLHHIDPVELLTVADSHFSVRTPGENHVNHIPFCNVLKLIEDDQGVEIRRGLFTANQRFNLVVKIGHVVMQPIA
jgi:hypothetical protein